MKPLTQDSLIEYAEYERQREDFRRWVIELKRARRISVGPNVTLVFENRDTIQFQIQEMIRAERIVDPVKVQEELDVYNALLPAPGELSATLFIEITDSADIKRDLDAFQGIDRGQTVSIEAGDQVSYGQFEGGHSKEDKISAVHFVRFPISTALLEMLRAEMAPLTLKIRHRHYEAEVPVPVDLRRQWVEDLGGG